MTQRAGALATATVLGALGLSGGSVAGASSTYGPKYAHFTVAFPSKPTSESNTKAVLQGFPTGTVTTATAYWVSPVADPFKSTNAPPTPTYAVIVGKAKSPKKAAAFMSEVKSFPGVTTVNINGAKGYRLIGTESSLEGSSHPPDPTAAEGLELLAKGDVIYSAEVLATRAQAKTFLQSLSPG
jgi:hypothetical protein